MPPSLSVKSLSSDTNRVDRRNWILSSPFSLSSIYIKRRFLYQPRKRESIKQTGSGFRCAWNKAPSIHLCVKVIQRATTSSSAEGDGGESKGRVVVRDITPDA